MSVTAKQCSVLMVDPEEKPSAHRKQLEALGFRVQQDRAWPEDDRAVLEYEVIIVRLPAMNGAPMLAARLRAKPQFGRRVLIALVPPSVPAAERMSARASGFDEVLSDCCEPRQLSSRILRRLRTRPEYHCVLPPGDRKRRAA